MPLTSLWRWFSRGPSSPIRTARPQRAGQRVRPRLEPLENRVLPSVVSPAGLVAWYRAEGNASDFSGGHDGTLLNGATFTAGKVGQAFLFEGFDGVAGDHVSIPNSANQDPGSNFTVEAWVNPSSSGHGRPIAQKRAGNTGYTFETTQAPYGPDDGLQFVAWIGGSQRFLQTPEGVLTNDVWQHVAATYDGMALRIYVDGVEQASAPASGAIDDSDADVVIGQNVMNLSYAWQGAIDEVSFYNRALTQEEIQAIYNAGAEGKETYDAAGDFSLTGNPNGAWSYGWSAMLGGAFIKDVVTRSDHPAPGLQSWDGPIGGFFPNISKNTTNATVVVSSVTWQPGQMVNHPGPNGEFSVLRWTAPKAGEVEVFASFSGADSTTTDVHVLFNQTTLAGCDGNVNGFGPGPTCSETLVVEIGDTIDFVVGFGNGNANYSNDSTGVDAHVTYVNVDLPDPTPEIDLGVSISNAHDPVAPTDNITYTITVTNNGPVDATNVTLTETVPANTTFVSFTPLAGGTSTTPAVGGGGAITSTMSSLAADASVSFLLVVQVNPSAAGGAISNSVSVSGSSIDPNTANNTANATTAVQLRPTDLVVSMIDLPNPVMIGGNLTYTITVTNAPTVAASAVSVSTATPAHTTFQSVTAPAGWIASTPATGATGLIQFTNVSLLAGASATFTAVVQVDQGLDDGIILSNTVSVASANADSNTTNNSKTVSTNVDGLRTDLAITVTSDDLPEFPQANSLMHFDILVTNTSSAAVNASNVALFPEFQNSALEDLTMPAGWTFTDFHYEQIAPGVIISEAAKFTTATMLAGADARFRVGVRVNSQAALLSSFRFSALISWAGRDTNTANDSYSVTKTVYGMANDLAVTGTVQPYLVESGGQLTYTIKVTNRGGSAVDDVVAHVATSIPEQTQFEANVGGSYNSEVGPVALFPTATSSQGRCTPHFSLLGVRDGPVDCYLGTLAGGASATIVVTVVLPLQLPDDSGYNYDGADVVNVVNVESGVRDPVVGNNVAAQATPIRFDNFTLARIDSFAYYLGEDAGNLRISVSRVRDTGNEISYIYETEDISAREGVDYSAVFGSGTLEKNQFSADFFSIPILDNPHLDGNRSFRLSFNARGEQGFGDSAITLAHTISAIVTIFDNETEPRTVSWNSDLGGLWTDPANWDGGFVPRLGDNVIIDRPGIDITVRIPDGHFSIGALTSNENIVVDGGSLTVTRAADLRSLNVQTGATVTFSGNQPVIIRGNAVTAGTLNIHGDGSVPSLVIEASGQLNVGGTLATAGTIDVRGSLSGTGTIRGNVVNTGFVRPGNSPGILTIEGNYTQTPEGTLVLEIGGTRPGLDYDQLVITGTANLAGQAQIVLVNGFQPQSIAAFQLVSSASHTGTLVSTNPAFVLSPSGAASPILPATPGTIIGQGGDKGQSRGFSFSAKARVVAQKYLFTGQLAYLDSAVHVQLRSTSITSVRVEASGVYGMIQGKATVNGKPGFHFTVWVEDRQPAAGGNHFRIVIEGPNGFRYDSDDNLAKSRLLDRSSRIHVLKRSLGA